MAKKKLTGRGGFTLTELMVAIVVSVIVVGAIAVVLVDGMRGWNRMYSRVYADVVTDSHVARRMFEAEVRKASRERFLVDADGNWLEVYQYADSSSTEPDRYARFYTLDDDLNVEYGIVDPRETLRVQTVCGNVTSCAFLGQGCSAQMILTLDDGSQSVTTVASAVMHNQ
jgi:prepilin-type N-terminal cleavage/methylation domain-containing protein